MRDRLTEDDETRRAYAVADIAYAEILRNEALENETMGNVQDARDVLRRYLDVHGGEMQHIERESMKVALTALSIVDALADGDVYHDSKGGMLIVAKPDELLGKAKSLANK